VLVSDVAQPCHGGGLVRVDSRLRHEAEECKTLAG
jgi:hypothetical protein